MALYHQPVTVAFPLELPAHLTVLAVQFYYKRRTTMALNNAVEAIKAEIAYSPTSAALAHIGYDWHVPLTIFSSLFWLEEAD